MSEQPTQPTLDELAAEIVDKDGLDENTARFAAALNLGLTRGDAHPVDKDGNEDLTES